MKISHKACILLVILAGINTSAWAFYKCCPLDSVALCGEDCCTQECDKNGKCPTCDPYDYSTQSCCETNKGRWGDGVCCNGTTGKDMNGNANIKCCAPENTASHGSEQECCATDEVKTFVRNSTTESYCCPNDKKDFVTGEGKCCSNAATYESDKDCFCALHSDDPQCVCDDEHFYRKHYYYDKTVDIEKCGCPTGSVEVNTSYGKTCCKGNMEWDDNEQSWYISSSCSCSSGNSSVGVAFGLCYRCNGNSVLIDESIRIYDLADFWAATNSKRADLVRDCCNAIGGQVCEGSCERLDINIQCALPNVSDYTCKDYYSEFGSGWTLLLGCKYLDDANSCTGNWTYPLNNFSAPQCCDSAMWVSSNTGKCCGVNSTSEYSTDFDIDCFCEVYPDSARCKS